MYEQRGSQSVNNINATRLYSSTTVHLSLHVLANNVKQSLISNVSGLLADGRWSVSVCLHRADSCSIAHTFGAHGIVYNYWQVSEAEVRPRKVRYTTGMSSP